MPLWLAAVNPDLLKRIQSSPLGERLGRDRMFMNLYKVREAWEKQRDRGDEPDPPAQSRQ